MKKDVLRELYNKKMTKKDIDNLYIQLRDSGENNVLEMMGFDLQTEGTALVLHDISYQTLAKWRYEGWPNTCVICHKIFDVQKDAWRAFRKLKIDEKTLKNVMTHWDCYTDFRKKLSKESKGNKVSAKKLI